MGLAPQWPSLTTSCGVCECMVPDRMPACTLVARPLVLYLANHVLSVEEAANSYRRLLYTWRPAQGEPNVHHPASGKRTWWSCRGAALPPPASADQERAHGAVEGAQCDAKADRWSLAQPKRPVEANSKEQRFP